MSMTRRPRPGAISRRRAIGLGAAALASVQAGSTGTAQAAAARRLLRRQAEAAFILDPLSAEEIETTVAVLRQAGLVEEDTRFAEMGLEEPEKTAVLAAGDGATGPRAAQAILYHARENRVVEAVVDLVARRLIGAREIAGVQPRVFEDEDEIVDTLVRADARWQAAMARRGITDTENVLIDAWAPGDWTNAAAPGSRILRTRSGYLTGASTLHERPVEGVEAIVDVTNRRVLAVLDPEPLPLPPEQDLLAPAVGDSPRAVGGPPPTFRRDGYAVRWEHWRFRWSVHPREGLILYTVSYEDGGRPRSVLYRASLAEMVVPYGDPSEPWGWRAAFDVSEYGFGQSLTPLEPGVDVPADATRFDVVFADDDGAPAVVRGAVALYERDGGLLWKAGGGGKGAPVRGRRARQLVLAAQARVGNYVYGLNWVFWPDGGLALEVELTGILLTRGARAERVDEPGEGPPRFGTLVGQQLVAPNHQHFFCFRLDLDVDGTRNSVVEMDVRAVPEGPENPLGNAFAAEPRLLGHEAEAQRDLSHGGDRWWTVVNERVRNEQGYPAGYSLVPGESARPYLARDNRVRRRAGFVDHALWVTPYARGELYAAGDYPNQSGPGEGLPRWTAADRALRDTDVVLWYTLGVSHVPRVEDWPVMTVHRTGFSLLPDGFFSGNASLGLPPREG
jgi:primary-amine oxidase